jgi:hypothetical protein
VQKLEYLAAGVLASTTYNNCIADLLFLSEMSHSCLVAGTPCVHLYSGKSNIRGNATMQYVQCAWRVVVRGDAPRLPYTMHSSSSLHFVAQCPWALGFSGQCGAPAASAGDLEGAPMLAATQASSNHVRVSAGRGHVTPVVFVEDNKSPAINPERRATSMPSSYVVVRGREAQLAQRLSPRHRGQAWRCLGISA